MERPIEKWLSLVATSLKERREWERERERQFDTGPLAFGDALCLGR